MEVLVYGLLTTIWWMASFSILLPFFLLLVISKSIRDVWFSFFYTLALSLVYQAQFFPNRKRAFKVLNTHLAKTKRRSSEPLKILEIGIAFGANLEFYPDNSLLTTLDVNASFEKYFEENKKKFPHVTYERNIVAMAEDMKGIEDDTFDIVVATFLLCSVSNVQKSLKEIRRVLKPGGVYLFLEHGAFPKGTISYYVQKYTQPIWYIYIDGCHIDRDAADPIHKTGFSDVHYERIFLNTISLYLRPQLYGIAIK